MNEMKKWLVEDYYTKAGEELQQERATGATWRRFCEGAKEKEGNPSVQTAWKQNNRNIVLE